MIPKIIHYCWFGKGELSELEKRCIRSWDFLTEKARGYKVIRWDEDNFPIEQFLFAREAYDAKKWAFVSDYARIWILIKYGGIYLDTDYELYKDITPFLNKQAFIGCEADDCIGTGIIGMEKDYALAKEVLAFYDSHPFKISEGQYNMIPNSMLITDIIREKGWKGEVNQQFHGLYIAEKNTFYPSEDRADSYGRHHYQGSWWSEREKKRANNKIYRGFIRPVLLTGKKVLKKLIGNERTHVLENVVKNKLK